MHAPSADMNALPAVDRAQLDRIARLPELVNDDEVLVRRGRWVSLEFQVQVGDFPVFLTVKEGRIAPPHFGALRMHASTFVIRAQARDWDLFWQPMPEPWSQDLFAMVKKGRASIDGDLHPFMANLQYFKDLLAAPRRLATVHA